MTDPIETRRRFYAEELRFTTRMRSSRVEAAFATVPRERFVGDGPWRVKSLWNMANYWTTEDADPRNVYHDILIALEEKLGLNNGQPSLWAFLFDRLGVAAGERVLHLGSGTGYYTAILAELAGRKAASRRSTSSLRLQSGREPRLRHGRRLFSSMVTAPAAPFLRLM